MTLKFSQQSCWGFKSSGMWQCVLRLAVPDIDPRRQLTLENKGNMFLPHISNHSSNDTHHIPKAEFPIHGFLVMCLLWIKQLHSLYTTISPVRYTYLVKPSIFLSKSDQRRIPSEATLILVHTWYISVQFLLSLSVFSIRKHSQALNQNIPSKCLNMSNRDPQRVRAFYYINFTT
jgi:hypothetical protein